MKGATVNKLRELLTNDWPVIIFLYAVDLHHGGSGLHAIVLVEIVAQQAVLLNPAQKETTKIELKTLDIIWTNFGNQGMVIWP